ncbi:D-2-hydroxyacid dehydrogenase family protein [Paenibacillus doosanensis]|uniref:D-2-hydroxyacid dehydrogenase family protein n=1 Tax=Paenibacillus doosanensis TaxID=1229154 RepID=UPI00218062EC|nr:D-2-hydroxyacid dehydrogenase family protein [Paenibacillus doosanensis]MCS7463811.1 D-2-hydroxyacid dehydrogenase family protein [Paenibacillus doosanensis]
MIRCAVLDDYQQVAKSIADWASIEDRVEVTVFHEHMADEDELAAALAPFEIIVIMRERTPFRAPLLARLPNLKLLVTTGMRNASVDLEAAAARGVVVSGTSGLSSHTAELTWALILGLARHIVQEHGAVRQGMWQSTLGTDLCGKKLGVLGLGKLGGRVAKIGLAFGMEVAAWSQNLTQERADEAGVRLAGSKEELLAESDFVSIHLVLSDRTRGLIGAEQLKLMRPDAYLINTSRAPIVDQAALAQALCEGWIAGAGLDVYETEPLPKDHPFRTLPNVLTTPHLGYVTKDNYRVFYQDAVDDIWAFLEGAPIRRLA